ncbi:MAG: PASTA domain-containing protein [Bacteroidetes bacterium]|jgi:eukaryotic-like serine/threonine-protein kinase|nr:PASTA domain-containing protein [Bacteroidota bacterium]
MKNWLKFLFSRAFLRTSYRIGWVWLVVLGGMWIFLHFYSRHGDSMEVPEIRGLLLQDAEQSLMALGLEVIHLDSVYSRDGRPFEVIEQMPPPGSGIKSGRKIYVSTYRSTPPNERVGVTEGQDLAIARIILENKGFRVEERQEPNIALVGRVIRVENRKGFLLSADSRIPRGSRVRLISGTTTNELVAIPSLIGQSLDSARAQLTRSQLSVGLVEYSMACEDAKDSLNSTVLHQHLKATNSRIVPAGTELDLYLGLPGDNSNRLPRQN